MQHPPATKSQIFSWTLFDFANTGYYVIIITLVFQPYFVDVIAGGNVAYWGRTIAASMLITAAIGPMLGAVADATQRKKLMLAIFTAACVAATIGLYFTGAGTLWMAVFLLIVANIGFEGGTIFYDAFLPELVSEELYARVSGFGFAMGYLGSIVCLLLVILIAGDEPSQLQVRSTFLLAGVFFALFSLPLFLFVPEHRRKAASDSGGTIDDRSTSTSPEESVFLAGYRRVGQTIKHLRNFTAVKRFLIAYFVYNDGILTVIIFASTFATVSLKMGIGERTVFFLIVQGTALAGSLLFGWLANKIGPRRTIVITLLIWIGVVIAAYFVETKEVFYVIGAVAGMALGSSQSTSRAYMSLLTPFDKKTEFFGFYDGFFGKASAVIGPLVFGEVAQRLGQRPAMLLIGVMIVLGIVLIHRVPEFKFGQSVQEVA